MTGVTGATGPTIVPTPTVEDQCSYLGVDSSGEYAFREVLNQNNGDYAVYNGFAMWCYDPLVANTPFTPTPGVLYLSKIFLNCPQFTFLVRYVVATAATSLAAGQNFIGIYSGEYELIASTPDLTAQLTGLTGVLSADLNFPAVLGLGQKYFAFLCNGTGLPSLFAAPMPNADAALHLTASDPRFSSVAGPFTSLPATIDPLTLLPGTHTIWAGI